MSNEKIIKEMPHTEKKNIIVMFGHHSWTGLLERNFSSRCGQMLQHLHDSERVDLILYVNPYFFSVTILSLLKNIVKNIVSFSLITNVVRKRGPFTKIKVVNIVHTKRFCGGKRLFYWRLRKVIEKERTSLNAEVILWGYNPAEHRIFDLIPYAKKVFDTVDNWIEMDFDEVKHPFYRKAEMEEGYKNIVGRNDVTIISNGKAMTNFYTGLSKGNPCVVEVPNGINTALFSPEKLKDTLIPEQLRAYPRPLIGYVGVVQERFDIDLYKYLLEKNSRFTFVIVGPIMSFRNFELNFSQPNFVHIEPKPYSEIPAFINAFDVCIIPHIADDMTTFMSPMKIYEYLAMGKAVVTTPVGGIEEVAEFCSITDDCEVFNTYLQESLNRDNSNVAALIHARYSWDIKIEKILEIILTHKV